MNQWFSLEHRTVVITGGSGGLGTPVVAGLVDMGASVVVADVVRPVVAHECLHYAYCDLSDTASIRRMYETAQRMMGRIDVLINCAYYGAGYGPDGNLERLTDADWMRGLDGSIGVTFRSIREVVPFMAANGGGSIVNFASVHGLVAADRNMFGDSGLNTPANYSAGKAGVIQFTRYSAMNLAPKGIRVNCVTPGTFPSEEERRNESLVEELSKQTILGRVGKPEEIVGAVLFLASDASSYMTGANIIVDGGWTAW